MKNRILILAFLLLASSCVPATGSDSMNPAAELQQIVQRYCGQLDMVQLPQWCTNPGMISPPSVSEAIDQIERSHAMLINRETSAFTDHSRILTLAGYAIRALDYLERSHAGMSTTGFPLVVKVTGIEAPEQQAAFQTIWGEGEAEGIPSVLMVGPNTLEVAESAAMRPSTVFGVGTQYGLAAGYLTGSHHDTDLDRYGAMTDKTGVGFIFDIGVESIPSGTAFDSIIMQHPNPVGFQTEQLCKSVLPLLKVGGYFILVPDQDYANDRFAGVKRDPPGFTVVQQQVHSCVGVTAGLFSVAPDENITPEELRGLTGYNASKQWTGEDFSPWAEPDGTLLKIIVVKRID